MGGLGAEAGTGGREPFSRLTWGPSLAVPSKQAGPEVDPEAGATDSHLKTSLLLLLVVPHRVQAGL